MNAKENSEWLRAWGNELLSEIEEELDSLKEFKTKNYYVKELVRNRIKELENDKRHFEQFD